jgi:hypothetical protein
MRFHCMSSCASRTEDDVDPPSLSPSPSPPLQQLSCSSALASSSAWRASTSQGTSVPVTQAYKLRHRLASVSDIGAV